MTDENNQGENNASRARSSKATRHLRRVEAVGAGAAEIPDSRADAEEGLASGGEVSSPKSTKQPKAADSQLDVGQLAADGTLGSKTLGSITLGSTNLSAGNFRSSTLAPVQRQTLEFLRNFIAEKGYAPTLKDIASHIGVKSLSTAHFHLERLVDKGFIKRGDDGMVELVEVAKPELGPTAVPLVGVIAAGMPIEAIEQTTFIDIPPSMIDGRGEVFCLEVSGTSMIDAHICDQDIVVVKKQTSAENGQIVVALLEDGSATLKTYRRLKSGKIMLIPANPTLSPITLDHVSIQGRVIGVIRQLH